MGYAEFEEHFDSSKYHEHRVSIQILKRWKRSPKVIEIGARG